MTVTDEINSMAAGLEALLAAIRADDPKREIAVRVGDLMKGLTALTAALSGQVVMAKAVADIVTERKRQVEVEEYGPSHDDEHSDGSLAAAAAVYALGDQRALIDDPHSRNGGKIQIYPTAFWRWSLKWWKPKDQRRNLVMAGALIIADIERLDRAAAPPPSSTAGEGK